MQDSGSHLSAWARLRNVGATDQVVPIRQQLGLERRYPMLEIRPEWLVDPVCDVGKRRRHVYLDQLLRFGEVPPQALKLVVAHI